MAVSDSDDIYADPNVIADGSDWWQAMK